MNQLDALQQIINGWDTLMDMLGVMNERLAEVDAEVTSLTERLEKAE